MIAKLASLTLFSLLISSCLQGFKDQEAFDERIRQPDLVAAAMNGQTSKVKELVSAGADVNLRWLGSTTPLMAAATGDHGAVIEYLLLSGADPDLKDKAGDTALTIAIRSNSDDAARVLRAWSKQHSQ